MTSLLKPFNDLFRAAIISMHAKILGNQEGERYHYAVSQYKISYNFQYKQKQDNNKKMFLPLSLIV